jgi:hypothetical protein
MDTDTLLIVKEGTNKFYHTHNGIAAGKFIISSFAASLDGDKFKIVENDGAVRFTYLVQNITIIDNTSGGATFNYISPLQFWNKLIDLQYTPFFQIPINVLTTDELDAIHGANTPSASNPFATMDDVSAGGDNLQSVTDGAGNNITTNPIYVSSDGGSNGVVMDKTEGVGLNTNSTTSDPNWLLQSEDDGASETYSKFKGTSTGGLVAECVFASFWRDIELTDTPGQNVSGFTNLQILKDTTSARFEVGVDFVRTLNTGEFTCPNFIPQRKAIQQNKKYFHSIRIASTGFDLDTNYKMLFYSDGITDDGFIYTTDNGSPSDEVGAFGITFIVTEHINPNYT